MIIELRANLLTEQGSSKKLLIPPHTTKLCLVDHTHHFYLQEMRYEAYVTLELAKRSLLLTQTGPFDITANEVLIYNGGWENQWIENRELVVNIYEFRN